MGEKGKGERGSKRKSTSSHSSPTGTIEPSPKRREEEEEEEERPPEETSPLSQLPQLLDRLLAHAQSVQAGDVPAEGADTLSLAVQDLLQNRARTATHPQQHLSALAEWTASHPHHAMALVTPSLGFCVSLDTRHPSPALWRMMMQELESSLLLLLAPPTRGELGASLRVTPSATIADDAYLAQLQDEFLEDLGKMEVRTAAPRHMEALRAALLVRPSSS
jgi:hypothetical protein